LAKNDTDQWLLVNVWATWCGPCVQELPEFVTTNRMYRHRKLKVITISLDDLDQAEAAKKVLQDQHAALVNYISAISSPDRLADLLDREWRGPVPHTIVIAPGGKIVYRSNGDIKPLEVRQAIVERLDRTYANRIQK
jgi:thiol-disulfide isomerase/thioredoxin